jgi:hypothetical protein
MSVLLVIGTGKGLFLAHSEDDRKSWDVSGPHFPMTGAYGVGIDKRSGTPRLLAGVASAHFGPSVSTSDDLGASWQEPDHAPLAFPAGTGASLDRVWQLTPGPQSQPGRVYAGTQPSALFVSDDGGQTFEMVRGLWDHPHREHWGAGFGGQAIHPILRLPTDTASMVVAMSTGGVYRTADGGATWAPSNTGIKAYFLPDQFPEFGQCVHKAARDAVDPDRLYAQNHHGVYRSDDGSLTWSSIAEPLPSDFGFAMVAHPTRTGVIYTFPLAATVAASRSTSAARCSVAGRRARLWSRCRGLPRARSPLRPARCDAPTIDRPASTSAPAPARYASRDEGDPGIWWPHTCRTCSAYGPRGVTLGRDGPGSGVLRAGAGGAPRLGSGQWVRCARCLTRSASAGPGWSGASGRTWCAAPVRQRTWTARTAGTPPGSILRCPTVPRSRYFRASREGRRAGLGGA